MDQKLTTKIVIIDLVSSSRFYRSMGKMLCGLQGNLQWPLGKTAITSVHSQLFRSMIHIPALSLAKL